MGSIQEAPATKRDLASVESSLTREIANLGNELKHQVRELQARAVLQEVQSRSESSRREMTRGKKALRAEMRGLRREIRTVTWMTAVALAMMCLVNGGIIGLLLRASS